MKSISDLMRNEPPLFYGASAVYPNKMLWEQQYRFTSRYDEEVLLHRRVGKNIHLPRALCPVGPVDARSRGVAVKFPKKPTPKDNQTEVFDAVLACLDKGQSGIAVAYTGWGKTVLGYAMAAHVQRRTLIVTTKDDVYTQWLLDAPKFLGISPLRVGHIRGDSVVIHDCDIVVAMIHTLAKNDGRVTELDMRSFGLVIFDECQRVPAESFSVVADMFPAFWRWGLSATPDRSDGKELLLYCHLGPIRAQTETELMVPKVLRYKTNWKCPRVGASDPKNPGKKIVIRLPHSPGKTAHIENRMVLDDERNRMIVQLAITAHGAGRKTIIFSTQVEHLHTLRQMTMQHGVHHGDIGLYVGATGKADLAEREKAVIRPLLYATYGMGSEGTNLPWFDTVILAIPRGNVAQPVGRIRREYEKKRDPVVMDLVDLDSPVFTGYAATRKKWYASIGCTIKDMW